MFVGSRKLEAMSFMLRTTACVAFANEDLHKWYLKLALVSVSVRDREVDVFVGWFDEHKREC